MRGLKQQYKIITIARNGRIFYRCVDWNLPYGEIYAIVTVASFTDAWIETNDT